jgi:Flp pilus assembly protein TadG
MSGSRKAPLVERLPRPRALARRLRLDERGTALVEFALVAPVLFLLIFGVLDFSLALNSYNQASQLVGLGARAAAVNRNPDGTQVSGTSIQTQLAQQYAQGGLKNNPVCITLPNGAGAGQPVKVTSTYQFRVLPLLSAIVGSPTVSITASQTMRQEINGTYSTGCAS